MSKTAYVVMAGADSPVAIVIPSPYAVFMTRKDAVAYAKDKNFKAKRNKYYVRTANLEPDAKR